MRTFLIAATAILAFTLGASAQSQFDAAVGFGTVTAPSAADATGNHFPQSVGGGTFINFSADYLFKKNFGVGGEIAWRASQNNYAGVVPFRPLFYDFNAVYAPSFGKHAAGELQAGIGAQSSRFYGQGFQCSNFTGQCTNYISSNHFMGHFAAGLKLYPKGNFFIRPEAHLYLVRNNEEFSSPRSTRFGVSLGYTFGKSDY